MGIGDMVNQAKDAVQSNPAAAEAVDGGVDQVRDAVAERTPDQMDGAVDQAAQAVKDQI